MKELPCINGDETDYLCRERYGTTPNRKAIKNRYRRRCRQAARLAIREELDR